MQPGSTVTAPAQTSSLRRLASFEHVVFFVLAVLLIAGIARHIDGLNGPSYWRWPWRRLDVSPLYPAMLLAMLPVLAAQRLGRNGERVALPLHLLVLGTFALELVAAFIQGESQALGRVTAIVKNPWATSYFTAAPSVTDLDAWLGDFVRRQASFPLHANNKPPGPILFFAAMLRLFPNHDVAATAGGLLIGALAGLIGPATFWMGRALKLERAQALQAACLVSLSPGLVLFFPEFDQVWPVLGCAMVALWSLALESRRLAFAVAFGAATAISAFFTWNLLTLGVTLALLMLWTLLRREDRLPLREAARLAAVALATIGAIYLALWLATGYDPVAVFLGAHRRVQEIYRTYNRSYPATIPWDLEDALFGFGWLGVLLLATNLVRTIRRRSGRALWLTVLPLLQVTTAPATSPPSL